MNLKKEKETYNRFKISTEAVVFPNVSSYRDLKSGRNAMPC